MIAFESMQSFLRCPCCQSSALTVEEAGSQLVCGSCGSRYPLSHGRPVLLRSDNDVFAQKDYLNATALRQMMAPVSGNALFRNHQSI